MPFSPKAPTVGVFVLCVRSPCSLCLCGEKSVPRCSPSSKLHDSCSDVHHSMLAWCALQPQCRAPESPIFGSPCLPHLCSPLSKHDMHIFDVNKCTYLYRQPPSSTPCNPTKTLPMWGSARQPPSFVVSVLRPSSTVHRPSSASPPQYGSLADYE